MSVLNHPLWPELRRYVRIEPIRKEQLVTGAPRIRVEFAPMPPDLQGRALMATMPCVACRRSIHFVRDRNAVNKRGYQRHLYYAACCPHDVNRGCANGAKSSIEYERIRQAMADGDVRAKAEQGALL